MAVGFSNTNKPINPRGQDASPLAFNRAKLYSGKALDFDGVNDEITPSGSYFVNPQSGTWTFCAYIYAENSGVVFSRDNQYVELRLNAGKLVARVYAGSWQILTLSNVDLLNKWNFVCWKYDVDNSTFTGYVNGVEQLTETLAPDSVLSFDRIASTGGSNFFDGKIGGVKIYNVGLTAAQVADLYNNPEKVVPTGVDNTALKLWLPMMEGAGTTAYDGSGNGNHGTISGATYVNGVGSPVAQSAVIDWNKGTNLLANTNIFDGYWTKSGGTLTTGIEAPDGTNTAFKFERDDASLGAIYNVAPTGLSSTNYRYVYAKLPSGSASASAQLMSHNTNTNNTFTITDEWQRFKVNSAPNTAPTNFYIVDFRGGVGVDEIHLWAPQAAAGTDESVFVPTIGTSQDTPVLLPQGFTSGRDITGVNLFENVRKQGALNLDGNSWAEVHDNASLDITSAITLECWINSTDKDQYHHILSKNKSGNTSYAIITEVTTGYVGFEMISGEFKKTDYNVMDGNWNHIVVTYDETNLKFYINGALDDTIAYTSAIPTNDVDIHIGARPDGVQLYEASIAQPRIYNRALTASEVLQNYNSGKNTYK